MELDVTDKPNWKTIKRNIFDDGRELILKKYEQIESGPDYQIMLMNKGDCELIEVMRDWYSSIKRFEVLVDLIK